MKHFVNLPLRVDRPIPRYAQIESGIQRQVRYKPEAVFGTQVSGAAGGQILRRVKMGLVTDKDTYASQEKVSHMQDIDFRHGDRKVKGSISGELSPSTYADWHDGLMRRARTTVAASTALTITIAVSGAEYTITRTAGSWLTDGVKKGMVFRLTAGAFNANNLNKNIVVRAVSALVITGKPLSQNLTLTAEGPISTATATYPGKISYMPKTGHVNTSYTIEDWHPGLATPLSEQHYGCVMNSAKVAVPSSGIATIDWDIMGIDTVRSSGAAYFVSPSVETTTTLLASSTALYIVADAYNTDVATMNFSMMGNASTADVGGSVITPQVFLDKLQANGDMSIFFENAIFRDAFLDETITNIAIVIAADNTPASDFISYMFPRCKLNGAGKDDPNTGIQQAIPWKALYNSGGGAGFDTEQTTMMYQDSAAP